MKEIRIGLPIRYFTGWMGGASLALTYTDSILKSTFECFEYIRPILLYDATGYDIDIPDCGYLILRKDQINANGVFAEFIYLTTYRELVFYKDIRKVCSGLNIDILGPDHTNLSEDFPIPWISYIPDFQHRNLPEFFTRSEINSRDLLIRDILRMAPEIIVNSQTVIDDIRKYHSDKEILAKIKRFPEFRKNIDYECNFEEIQNKFKINKKYFIMCSQQWKHKRHDLVIKSFSEFSRIKDVECDLVITGEQIDYRHPNLNAEINSLIEGLELTDKVKYIGLIPKQQQLCLIDNSVGLIQASQIEGGPGASGVLEAAGLDVPIISSDIISNREMDFGRIKYFKSESVTSLTECLNYTFDMPKKAKLKVSQNESHVVNAAAGAILIRSMLSLLKY